MSADGNVVNLLGMAKTAAIGGNQEEALNYFNRVLEIDPTISEAWMGKGKATGWQSTMVNIRLAEANIAFSHAIANALEGTKELVTNEAVEEVNAIVVALYGMARSHLNDFAELDNTWSAYLGQVSQMLDALDGVRQWSPLHRTTLDKIVHLCKDNIEGYSFRDKFKNNTPVLYGINESYEALLRSQMNQAIDAIRSIDPAYAGPIIDKQKADACFVVTATMGDFEHPEVVLLRNFRDAWLMKKPWDPSFVRQYYRIGPTLAAFIRNSSILRRISLFVIVKPAGKFARRKLR